MPAPQPATIAPELEREIHKYVIETTSYTTANTFQFKYLDREIRKLDGADARSGSILKAQLYQVTGSLEDALYWSNNARKHHAVEDADHLDAVIFCNLGYFSQAADRLAGLPPQALFTTASSLLTICAIDELKALCADADASDAPSMVGLAEFAERCAMTLDSIKVSQEHVRKVLDLAGAVMREHRLFFLGDTPLVHAHEDGLLYQLLVDVEPSTAAEMTSEVVVRMVENDLDAPGLAFAFVGAKN